MFLGHIFKGMCSGTEMREHDKEKPPNIACNRSVSGMK